MVSTPFYRVRRTRAGRTRPAEMAFKWGFFEFTPPAVWLRTGRPNMAQYVAEILSRRYPWARVPSPAGGL